MYTTVEGEEEEEEDEEDEVEEAIYSTLEEVRSSSAGVRVAGVATSCYTALPALVVEEVVVGGTPARGPSPAPKKGEYPCRF